MFQKVTIDITDILQHYLKMQNNKKDKLYGNSDLNI